MNAAPNPVSLPIFDLCEKLPQRTLGAGEILLEEGAKTNRLYILVEGGVEVRKDGVLLKATAEKGAVFGEVSVLLDIPHIATVTAKAPSRFYEIADAAAFIEQHPEMGMTLAKLLAQRLSALSLHFSGTKVLVDALMDDTVGQPIATQVDQHAATAQLRVLETTRAEKNLQQQFRRISLFNQITRAMSERQNLNSLLHTVLHELEGNLPLDFGAVLLVNAGEDAFTVAATRVKLRRNGTAPDVRQGNIFAIAVTGISSCLDGKTIYAEDTRYFDQRLFRLLHNAGLHSVVAVPMMVAGKAFGVIIAARDNAEGFSSGECEFFRMLSDHVALAAHQARLYEQLQEAYDELQQTQQAVMQQERLRALGEMASGIAHDINNTLSPIVVYSELIAQTEDNLSAGARRHLNSIKTAGEDIAHLVSRLRDFYRKREDDEDVFPLDCNELIEQVIDLTRPRWWDMPLAKGIVITMSPELEKGLPIIQGNAAELREALANLILNAVDAMPAGGQLAVRTRLDANTPASRQSRVIIEVIDTGTGMDEATRARCLEPFFSTKGQRGTGLGLAMVYGIVDRHEGTIEIDSAPGEGTTMRITLPAARVANRVQTTTPTQPAGALRVLYIDDEPLLRDLMKETLELDGHSVAVAEHGQAGVDAFRDANRQGNPFNIVITDLGMPYMDGRQVAEALKKETPGIPIVLLTGWGAMMQSEGEHVVNVDAVISKPPRVNELRDTLVRLSCAG